jgi:hypothetical protein
LNAHISVIYQISVPGQGGDLLLERELYQSDVSQLPLRYIYENPDISNYHRIPAKNNQLIIIPSTVQHSVTPFVGEFERYSVAYDVSITMKEGMEPLEMTTSHPKNWVELSWQ